MCVRVDVCARVAACADALRELLLLPINPGLVWMTLLMCGIDAKNQFAKCPPSHFSRKKSCIALHILGKVDDSGM